MKVILVRWLHSKHIEASCVCNDDEVETVYKRTVLQLKDTDFTVSVINPTSYLDFQQEIDDILGV